MGNMESAVLHEDRLGRARARLAGTVLHGTVRNPQKIHLRPWQFAYSLEVITQQRVLRVRRRDELSLLSDTRLKVVVTDIQRSGRTTTVSLRLSSGGRAVGLPRIGEVIELGPGAFFGEVALLDQSVRTAQARAIEDAEIVALFRTEFYSLLETHSGIASRISFQLARVLAARLRQAVLNTNRHHEAS